MGQNCLRNLCNNLNAQVKLECNNPSHHHRCLLLRGDQDECNEHIHQLKKNTEMMMMMNSTA